jgi:acetyltransferase-like isoleucine patch superfamily enzyme
MNERPQHGDARIHPTALIESDVVIGSGTAIWDNVHLRSGARIGRNCIIGEKTYVAGGVKIADRVKINAFVYLCAGVTIEHGAMVSAGTVFTNDRNPRATTPDLRELLTSDVNQETGRTIVREGATIGANATIGIDVEIGRFAMVGMGSVVTRSAPDFHLVVGNPARHIGFVCRCGLRLSQGDGPSPAGSGLCCRRCGRKYLLTEMVVTELDARTDLGDND